MLKNVFSFWFDDTLLFPCTLIVMGCLILLEKGGDLLLSNTGLLGVLCSCHGLHMSIAKFSEVITSDCLSCSTCFLIEGSLFCKMFMQF